VAPFQVSDINYPKAAKENQILKINDNLSHRVVQMLMLIKLPFLIVGAFFGQ